MSTTLQKYLLSSAITFVAVFLTTLGGSVSSLDAGHLTGAALAGIVVAAVRIAVKAVFESPPALGKIARS